MELYQKGEDSGKDPGHAGEITFPTLTALLSATETWVSEWKMDEWLDGSMEGLLTCYAVVLLTDSEWEAVILK